MKIAIFDPGDYHHTYLYAQHMIFKDDEIDFYISEKLEKSLKENTKNNLEKYNFILKKKNNEMNVYFKESVKKINSNNYDFIFINTIQNNFLNYFYFYTMINKDVKVVTSIHNLNDFLSGITKLKVRHIYTQLIRKKILRRSNFINVYGENLKKYALEKGKLSQVTTLPFSIYEENGKKVTSSGSIKFVIPGSFELRRRDYYTLYNSLTQLPKEILQKIEIVFLGKPVGNDSKELLEKFKRLKELRKLWFYNEFVGENEFESQMLSSDFIIGPTNHEIYNGYVKEIYGLTKETGVTFAMIRYGLPGIIPEKIRKINELESSIVTYKNKNELSKILEKIVLNDGFRLNLKRNALINSKNFSNEKCKEKFLREINYF